MVDAFKRLHNKSCNYRELNDGNFSIGRLRRGFGRLDKARYMAPEVVRDEKKPNTKIDEFSPAVTRSKASARITPC